jgi:recombination associated protein RdgC
MWFRNLQLYRLGQHLDLTPEALDERLQSAAFRGCGRLELTTTGWVPPLGREGQQLVHAAGGYMMIAARKADKIIPAGVVNQLLEDKVAQVEAAESREVYRKERRRMKDDIIHDLLPHALTRHTDQYAYIDTRTDLVVVDSPTPARAEALISLLRTTLGSLKAVPVKVKQSVSHTLTRWLGGERLPSDFSLGEECELKHPDPEGGVITCRHQDLGAGEVRNHIKNGKYAVRLALHWKERLSCVLHEDLSIKRLRFEEVVTQGEEADEVDAATRFDLDFSLMTLELNEFTSQLLQALGGEEAPG